MGVGVVFRPQSPPEDLKAVAVAADAAGLEELWLWEDCFLEGGLTSAAAALAWTERITVGIGLLPVPLRNPAVVAMEIATLSRMFPDRIVPTVGHGVLDWMGQVGARAESPMTLLREHADAVRRLLHGERLDVNGRYVHLSDVALDWPPATVPPLLIGARGPKTVALAGEIGDGVLLDAPPTHDLAFVADAVRRARAAAETAGRGAPRIVCFRELDPLVPDLDTQAAEVVEALTTAGATSVVLQATATSPDPTPLIAVLRRR